ncbi:YihY/virulence factor BrkB family protein [Crenothrix polyspora]|uniref:Ribonuclease BN n=1 Tax=Crenothrix polyspora TaxID=360316 RepID=A0A1R4GZ95_9GAMM|nr:YihY/virulence factor BrkB family protein [Crenothrix polyspora]SJM89307.1 Ribonuclease BN [Crenothrix polyspora]
MKRNLIRFIKDDVWLLHEQKLPPVQAGIIKALKIILLAVQGFSSDLCLLRASALTLYSLLSIVPVIAMLFGIAKGFGFETMLEQRLIEQAPKQDTLVLQLISFARNLLDSTKGEVVAGIGLIVLFWTIISLIGNIEESFNAIWKIGNGRSLSRKFSDYLSLMLLAPVVLITSSSITVLLNTEITWLITVIHLPAGGTGLVIKALGLLPLLLMIGLFAFTFIFMPNHKINIKAGLVAGVVTGILYDFLQWAYLSLQIGVSGYNAIYGSFAALPLFVVWLQTGWMLVLLGCELAFFLQNYESYRNNNRFSDLSFTLQKVIALQIAHLIVKNFSHFNKPYTAAEIATNLVIPIAIIQPILSKLMASHLIVEFKNQDDEDEVYQPAMATDNLSIAFVINALEQCGQNQLPEVNQEHVFMNAVDEFRLLMETSEYNGLLKDR